jgi:hypothetical protein
VSPPFAPGPGLGRQIWESLPRVYREEDRQGHLGRYLDACGGLLDRIHETLRQRLDDTSLESCQEWLIPYFADLLDVRIVSPDLAAQRQEVANAVLWRKQQGTARSLEALAEAVLQTEVEYQEGWRRVAITPRIDSPLVPTDDEGARGVNMANPSQAARHPGLPAVTPDFRRMSTALRTEPGAPGSKVSRFPRRGSRDAGPGRPPLSELAPMSWRHENVHGLPRVPGSYQDLTRRTPDLRDPSWKTGHHHPRRILVFARPPSGFFPASPERMVAGLAALDNETEGDTLTFRPPAGVERATIRGPAVLSLPSGSTLRRCRIEDVNFIPDDAGQGGLTTTGLNIELLRVAASDVDIGAGAPAAGGETQPPVLTARDCLFGTVKVAGHAELEYCTVLARTELVATNLAASDCLFMGPLRRAQGANALAEIVCIRYSRLTPGDLQQLQATARGRTFQVTDAPARFISDRFGALSSGVLHPGTRPEILGGAEDGGELGAYHHRHHALRMRALADKLDDFIPLGQAAVIVYDPSLNCPPPYASSQTLTIDATSLTGDRTLSLRGVGSFSTSERFVMPKVPGDYVLSYPSIAGNPSAEFSIAEDGSVSIALTLARALAWDGSVLTVSGLPLTVDARALGDKTLGWGGVGRFSSTQLFSTRVLPGKHTLSYSTASGSAMVEFEVRADGTVSVAPELAEVLVQTGNTLIVRGILLAIDARALGSQRSLNWSGVGTFATDQVFSGRVLPGVHPLTYPTVVGNGWAEFAVAADGGVEIAAELRGALEWQRSRGPDGAPLPDTSVLRVRGIPLTIDATSIGGSGPFSLAGVGSFSPERTFATALLPGRHAVFHDPTNPGGHWDFELAPDGTITVGPALAGVLVQSDSTLQVLGLPLQLRADPTWESRELVLEGIGRFSTGAPLSARVLPGAYVLGYSTGIGTASVTFRLQNDGSVDVPVALEGVLIRTSPSVLTVRGFDLSIDAMSFGGSRSLNLGGIGPFDSAAPLSTRVFPGTHTVGYSTGADSAIVRFTVGPDGTVDYAPELDALLRGRGSRGLTVLGSELQIDGLQIVPPRELRVPGISPFHSAAVFSTRGLPGLHMLLYATAGNDMALIHFEVTPAGTIDYAPEVAGLLEGRGTPRLTLRGAEIVVDAVGLTPPRTLIAGGVGPFSSDQRLSLRVLPGGHTIQYVTAGNAVVISNFQVAPSGRLAELPSPGGGLEVRNDGRELGVVGLPVTITANLLPPRELRVGGIGAFSSSSGVTVRVLPGWHTLQYPGGAGATAIFYFEVKTDGTVEYEGAEGAVAGRGTPSLAVTGFEVVFDVSALGDAVLFDLCGMPPPAPTSGAHSLHLLPAGHAIGLRRGDGTDVRAYFDLTPAGALTITSDPSQVLRLGGSNRLLIQGREGEGPSDPDVPYDLGPLPPELAISWPARPGTTGDRVISDPAQSTVEFTEHATRLRVTTDLDRLIISASNVVLTLAEGVTVKRLIIGRGQHRVHIRGGRFGQIELANPAVFGDMEEWREDLFVEDVLIDGVDIDTQLAGDPDARSAFVLRGRRIAVVRSQTQALDFSVWVGAVRHLRNEDVILAGNRFRSQGGATVRMHSVLRSVLVDSALTNYPSTQGNEHVRHNYRIHDLSSMAFAARNSLVGGGLMLTNQPGDVLVDTIWFNDNQVDNRTPSLFEVDTTKLRRFVAHRNRIISIWNFFLETPPVAWDLADNTFEPPTTS